MTRATIKGRFTTAQIDAVLGDPPSWWPWHQVEAGDGECDLQPGQVDTAGWGSDSWTSGACRVWLHRDGLCIAGAWDVGNDIAFAAEVYDKLLVALAPRREMP